MIYVTHGLAAAAICGTPYVTYEVISVVQVRLRLARHRRLTRQDGRMLRRPAGGAR